MAAAGCRRAWAVPPAACQPPAHACSLARAVLLLCPNALRRCSRACLPLLQPRCSRGAAHAAVQPGSHGRGGHVRAWSLGRRCRPLPPLLCLLLFSLDHMAAEGHASRLLLTASDAVAALAPAAAGVAAWGWRSRVPQRALPCPTAAHRTAGTAGTTTSAAVLSLDRRCRLPCCLSVRQTVLTCWRCIPAPARRHDHVGGGFARYSVDELWVSGRDCPCDLLRATVAPSGRDWLARLLCTARRATLPDSSRTSPRVLLRPLPAARAPL